LSVAEDYGEPRLSFIKPTNVTGTVSRSNQQLKADAARGGCKFNSSRTRLCDQCGNRTATSDCGISCEGDSDILDRARRLHGNVFVPAVQGRPRVLARAPSSLAETLLGCRCVSRA